MSDPSADRSSIAIDNLRAVIILLVLAFHSSLAYLAFLPDHPFAFGQPPFTWRAFPIVDAHRFLGFDLFCAWLDVFLMSLFFMLSGLFAWPSLSRKGARIFLSDRFLRIGLPFALIVGLWIPLALYPSYAQSAADPTFAGYIAAWRGLPFWPAGPMWFLWLLLAWDLGAAGLFAVLRGRSDLVLRLSGWAREHPVRFLAGVLAASALAYAPLALVFGSSPWVQLGPLPLQLSRPAHYAVYFFAGLAIGACGIERGLLAPGGWLARHWRRWLVAAPLSFLLWISLTALVRSRGDAAPLGLQAADDVSFVIACLAGCGLALASAIQFGRVRAPLLDSLKANAYGMYLIHYLFVVWLQYTLLPADLPGLVKGVLVFAATLIASWGATALLRRVPAVADIVGSGRRRPAPRPLSAPAPRGGSEGLASRSAGD
ncbi:MAG TPA: acyltransferase [Stellaceae bacterium]|nr:acyltransferase [Stellaceae bacterium]